MKATVNLDGLHSLSSFHREQVLRAKRVGCFCCTRIFDPKLIKNGCDARGSVENKNKNVVWQTACCPFCLVDSILPDRTYGFRVTKKLLVAMERRWFASSMRRLPSTHTTKGK